MKFREKHIYSFKKKERKQRCKTCPEPIKLIEDRAPTDMIRNKKKEVKEDKRERPLKIRKEKKSIFQAGFFHWQHP